MDIHHCYCSTDSSICDFNHICLLPVIRENMIFKAFGDMMIRYIRLCYISLKWHVCWLPRVYTYVKMWTGQVGIWMQEYQNGVSLKWHVCWLPRVYTYVKMWTGQVGIWMQEYQNGVGRQYKWNIAIFRSSWEVPIDVVFLCHPA